MPRWARSPSPASDRTKPAPCWPTWRWKQTAATRARAWPGCCGLTGRNPPPSPTSASSLQPSPTHRRSPCRSTVPKRHPRGDPVQPDQRPLARCCGILCARSEPAGRATGRARVRSRHSFVSGQLPPGLSLKDSAGFDDWCLLTGERLLRQALEASRRLASHYEREGEFERACEVARHADRAGAVEGRSPSPTDAAAGIERPVQRSAEAIRSLPAPAGRRSGG